MANEVNLDAIQDHVHTAWGSDLVLRRDDEGLHPVDLAYRTGYAFSLKALVEGDSVLDLRGSEQ
ncbi:MAG: hypothetical protein ACRDHV_06405 [Actinomycetota bacterium]